MRYSAFLFCTKSSNIQFWTAQFGIATLQVLDCCMWLLATILNSTILTFMILVLGKSYMHSFSPWSQLSRSLFFCLVSISVLGRLHCSHSPKSNVSLLHASTIRLYYNHSFYIRSNKGSKINIFFLISSNL